jgi:cold shock CspA family protein
VREAGKKVVVASIWGSCAKEFTEADDEESVVDFDAVWLDDLHSVVEKKELPPPPTPQPTSNEGVYTRLMEPSNGTSAYPDTSGSSSTRSRRPSFPGNGNGKGNGNGASCQGVIKRVLRNDGYGFIRRDDGQDYYFNLHSLHQVAWERIEEDLAVTFRVLRDPSPDGKAGAAQQVQPAQDD